MSTTTLGSAILFSELRKLEQAYYKAEDEGASVIPALDALNAYMDEHDDTDWVELIRKARACGETLEIIAEQAVVRMVHKCRQEDQEQRV